MPTSAPGNERAGALTAARRAAVQRGFTLLELLVVVSIIGVASAGVSLALRDPGSTSLDREAARLNALLEGARAQSRMAGVPLRWRADPQGFHFEGLPGPQTPLHWLHPDTLPRSETPNEPPVLLLGPEPLIGPQTLLLVQGQQQRRIGTDGLRPFTVLP